MDIVGKETLEDMLLNFSGTVLFVSHDRYFIKKIASSLISFEPDGVKYYPYGYEQYLNSKKAPTAVPEKSVEVKEKPKKSFTTPLKERSRLERAIAKAEERVALLEEKTDGLRCELGMEENASDYLKLSEIKEELDEAETELDTAMNEWEKLNAEYEALITDDN